MARSRRFTVVLSIVGVVVLLATGFVLFVVASMSGGFDELVPRRRPKETSAEVVRARAKAEQATPAALTAIVDGPVQQALGGAQRSVGAPANESRCETGQHNWMIDDDYDLRCIMRTTSVVVATREGFRDQMLRLHERLLAAGWVASPPENGTPEAIVEYWDTAHGPYPSSPSGDDQYTPVDLPMEQYVRAGGRESGTRLEVKWTDRSDRFRPESATMAEGDYGLVLTLERVYFEK